MLETTAAPGAMFVMFYVFPVLLLLQELLSDLLLAGCTGLLKAITPAQSRSFCRSS